MAQGRPQNIADPNQLFDWIETGIDPDGNGINQHEGTLTAVPATTVDGTYGAEEAAIINALRVTVNQLIDILGLTAA